MDEKLLKAAMEGDRGSLITLIEQDPLILERRNNSSTTDRLETPLHIAAMLGHEAFVADLLKRKPGLARELDSTRSSPLHLASAGDHVETVKALLQTEPDMCSVCDRDGRNPLQIAAMMGRIRVLKEMLLVKGDAARAEMKRGGTVLHLCVEFSQLEALELLIENGGLQDLINSRDRNGNTVLHLAVDRKQIEITEFLLSLAGIDLEAVNSSGMTAMDVLMQRRTDATDLEIEDSLNRAGAIGADLQNLAPKPNFQQNKHSLDPNRHKKKIKIKMNKAKTKKNQGDWLDRKRSALMVVASLIATMAFQFAVTPPPQSIWNDTDLTANSQNPRSAIYYVRRAGNYLKNGERFYTINTASFVASLSIIMLLMSGLPLNHRVFVWLLMMTTWIAISAIALSYTLAVIQQTPAASEKYMYTMFAIAVFAWICLVSLLLVGHTIRLFVKMVRVFVKMIKQIIRSMSVKRRRWAPQDSVTTV